MSNYLIDASIYALPQKPSCMSDNSDVLIYEDYLNHLYKIFNLIFADIEFNYSINVKKNFDVNYFLFSEEDIKMLIENELIWDIHTIKNIMSMKLNEINGSIIEYLGKIIIDFLPKLQTRSKEIYKVKYKPSKICTLETLTGINAIEIKDNNSYLPEFSYISIIENNLKQNICKLAFLNKYVYLNKYITKIITKNKNSEYKIRGKINKLYHELNIDERNNIDISDIEILNITPDTIESKNYSISEILKTSNIFFKNIIINSNVTSSISQFQENITSKYTASASLKRKVEVYLNNYQNVIFDCISILNYFGEYCFHKTNKAKYLLKENYCNSIEDYQTCKKCRGLLKICGFDCSTGTEKIVNGKSFHIHLRPYTSGDEKYKDLTLRIYFEYDIKQKKIEIGHIGSHL